MESLLGSTISNPLDLGAIYKQLKSVDEAITRLDRQIHRNTRKLPTTSKGKTQGSDNPRKQELEVIRRLKKTHLTLDASRDTLLGLHGFLRGLADAQPRSRLSSLGILDLPGEILVKICEYTKGWRMPPLSCLELAPGVSEVKNFRLTCRQFCNVSSHLLLHHVNIEATPASLARFVDISHHPLVRRGMRAIRVMLHFYDSVLANDLAAFVRFNMQRMAKPTNHFMNHSAGYLDHHQMTEEMILSKIAMYQTMFASWNAWLEDRPTDDDLANLESIKICHVEYQKCFQDQQKLFHTGEFSNTLAAAVSRMPLVTRLELHDDDRFYSHLSPWHKELDDNGTFDFTNMLQPIDWKTAKRQTLGTPPFDLLIAVPLAIDKSGGSLLALEIQLSALNDISALVLPGKRSQDLKNALRSLEELKFSCGESEDGEALALRQPRELNIIKNFFSSLLAANTLQHLDLNFGFLWEWPIPPPSFSLGSVIEIKEWKNVVYLNLLFVPIRISELQNLLDNFAEELDCVFFQGISIVDGTWLEVLDVLREKPMGSVFLLQLAGAEVDNMSVEETNNVFISPDFVTWPPSQAQDYILGHLNRNPLLPVLVSESEAEDEVEEGDDLVVDEE